MASSSHQSILDQSINFYTERQQYLNGMIDEAGKRPVAACCFSGDCTVFYNVDVLAMAIVKELQRGVFFYLLK